MMKKYLFSVAAFCCCFLSFQLSAQSWKWVTGSRAPKSVIESWPIAVDGHGNVYGAGEVYTVPGAPSHPIVSYYGTDTVAGSGGVLACTDSNGNYRWAIHPHGSWGDIMISGIVADGDNVYAFGGFFINMTFGSFSLTTPWSGAYCAKINSSGNVVWLKKICDSATINAGALDAAGHLYLAGSMQVSSATIGPSHLVNATPGLSDALVVKMDTSGTALWATSFGGSGEELMNGIAVDAAGNSYVVGTFTTPSMTVGSSTLTYPGVADAGVVAKISASGTPLWGNEMIGRSHLFVNAVCVDNASNVYITGGTIGTAVFGSDSLTYVSGLGNPFYLASYNSAGGFRWVRSKGIGFQESYSVVSDVCNHIWLCGGMRQLSYLTDTMYIMAYDTSGYVTDSFTAPTGGDDQACLAVDNKGSLFICGDSWTSYRSDTFMFGSHALIDADSSVEALYIAKVSYPSCPGFTLATTQPVNVGAAPILYPNPANNECTISIANGLLSKAEVYDMAGKLATSYSLSGSSTTISTQHLRPGFYTCVITTGDNGRFTQKLAIMRR